MDSSLFQRANPKELEDFVFRTLSGLISGGHITSRLNGLMLTHCSDFRKKTGGAEPTTDARRRTSRDPEAMRNRGEEPTGESSGSSSRGAEPQHTMRKYSEAVGMERVRRAESSGESTRPTSRKAATSRDDRGQATMERRDEKPREEEPTSGKQAKTRKAADPGTKERKEDNGTEENETGEEEFTRPRKVARKTRPTEDEKEVASRNRYEALSSSEDEEDMEYEEEEEDEPRRMVPKERKKQGKIAPLIIREKEKWKNVNTEMKVKKINYLKAKLIQQGVQVEPTTEEDYRKLFKLLKEKKVAFYTYELKSEKKLKVVLRGVMQENTEEEQVYILTQKVEELLDEMRGRRTKKPMMDADKPKTAVPITKATCTSVSDSVNGAVLTSDNGPVANSVNGATSEPASEAVSNPVNEVDMDVAPPPTNKDFEYQRRAKRSSKRKREAQIKSASSSSESESEAEEENESRYRKPAHAPSAARPPTMPTPPSNTAKLAAQTANITSHAPQIRNYAEAVKTGQRKDETAQIIAALMPQLTQIIASTVAAALLPRNG
ncbi:hypothetical protein HHI36_022493 [Cryptolaemus montrouzieri]|uniref:Uncharacterized protein n=1 Tax=Cryptolaemus montrouzieri TaxID=559131 RepID=A0ABD2N184_9CUCU